MNGRSTCFVALIVASLLLCARAATMAAVDSPSGDHDPSEVRPKSSLPRSTPGSGLSAPGGSSPDVLTGGKAKRSASLAIQSTHLDRGPSFIQNRGQFDEKVKFQVKSAGKTLWLTNQGIVFDAFRAKVPAQNPSVPNQAAENQPQPRLSRGLDSGHAVPDAKNFERLAFSEDFVGANSASETIASGSQPGIYNYFIGNDPKKWVTDVAAYSGVAYRDLWPGIDLRLYRSGPNIEQEFVLKPGADFTAVQVAYKGIDGLRVADDGALVVKTAFGELRESRPRIYQEVAGQRVPVDGRFKLLSDTAYAFEVKGYQSQYALVIDPTLLYSTFLGGSAGEYLDDYYEQANGVAVDSSGNAYVTGFTYSHDFPTTTGAIEPTFSGNGGGITAFVTKLNPLGSQLVYSTYLNASASASGQGIAVDSAGEAYVVGWASDYPGQPEFPTTPNAFQTVCTESHFLAKLNAAGDNLVYSSCFGSDGFAYTYGGRPIAIGLDGSGHAYVAGTTACGIPTSTASYQPACLGSGMQAFMVEFDPAASGAASLVYGTYLGGTSGYSLSTLAYAVAVDPFGNAYVTGDTNEPDFPVTPGAFQTVLKGAQNCFVAKLNTSIPGTGSLIYSTYLGGSGGGYGADYANAIAVDSSGNAYVTGSTDSQDFPVTTGAFQTASVAAWNAFVSKLNPAGSNLVYSTYLGATRSGVCCSDSSSAGGIALDTSGDAYVVGSTTSPVFPVTSGAFQATLGNTDGNAFVTKFTASGSGLLYSSYLVEQRPGFRERRCCRSGWGCLRGWSHVGP